METPGANAELVLVAPDVSNSEQRLREGTGRATLAVPGQSLTADGREMPLPGTAKTQGSGCS